MVKLVFALLPVLAAIKNAGGRTREFYFDEFKKTVRWNLTVVTFGLIAAAIVAFSLIQLMREFENYVSRFDGAGVIISSAYGAIALAGMLALYFLLSPKKSRIVKEPSETPAENLVRNFLRGFAEGLHRTSR